MKRVLKVLGILLAVILVIALMIYLFVFQYPNLKKTDHSEAFNKEVDTRWKQLLFSGCYFIMD